MDFKRRLRLYLTGVFLGLIVVWFMLFRNRDRDLDAWLPKERVLQELVSNPLTYSQVGQCFMNCHGITDSAIVQLLREGEVNFGASKPREEPCKVYAVESPASATDRIRVDFAACDSSTVILYTIPLNADSTRACGC